MNYNHHISHTYCLIMYRTINTLYIYIYCIIVIFLCEIFENVCVILFRTNKQTNKQTCPSKSRLTQ